MAWLGGVPLSGNRVSIRSVIYFGLQSFAAVWLIHEFAASEGEGNAALAAMLAAGALGTLVGGRLVDRIGRRRVLVGSIVAQIPLLLGFVFAPSELAAAVMSGLAQPEALSAERRRVAQTLFHDPGQATARALALIRGLLHPSAPVMRVPARAGEETL